MQQQPYNNKVMRTIIFIVGLGIGFYIGYKMGDGLIGKII